MSVFTFFQNHIDTLQHSLDNIDYTKSYKLVDILLNTKGKIFFTGGYNVPDYNESTSYSAYSP